MAPSRALLRCMTSAPTHLHTASRALSTSVVRHPQRSTQPSALRPALSRHTPPATHCTRTYSQPPRATPEPPAHLNEAELHIFNKIREQLDPAKLEVQDISGGCGSMYALSIESPRFAGLSVVKQHKLVNAVLKEDIAKWHGVQLRTKAS
ncbi:bola protein [Ampelomyces quisqualis]|uniref:Bola protein n=1 Tax=Ampelomyces quisqualis TaxID=50730 RepID=A0A6A5QPX2_AMPQU|nr:bola protein [Ampelomyces quisqualis]